MELICLDFPAKAFTQIGAANPPAICYCNCGGQHFLMIILALQQPSYPETYWYYHCQLALVKSCI
uniref:Uncharacterized protein n=1 Tax=Manihot esculenta TaxID=3983 RepID=A0A2C9UVH3_MANES